MSKYDEALKILIEEVDEANCEYGNIRPSALKSVRDIEELVKRATPMKPLGISITHEGRCANCPSCNKLVHEQTKDAYNRPLHVCHCGQLIDWSDK